MLAMFLFVFLTSNLQFYDYIGAVPTHHFVLTNFHNMLVTT